MSTSLWPAILLASIALPPTSCRQVMLARRRESGPKPWKSQPSAAARAFERLPDAGIPHGPTAWFGVYWGEFLLARRALSLVVTRRP